MATERTPRDKRRLKQLRHMLARSKSILERKRAAAAPASTQQRLEADIRALEWALEQIEGPTP